MSEFPYIRPEGDQDDAVFLRLAGIGNDPEIDLAGYGCLADESSTALRSLILIAGSVVSDEEKLRRAYQRKVVTKSVEIMGGSEKTLSGVFSYLKTVIRGAPEEAMSNPEKEVMFKIIHGVLDRAEDFKIKGVVSSEIPLTDENIDVLGRLSVLTYEVIQKLMAAVRHYGKLTNYGRPIVEEPVLNLMELYSNLFRGEFLNAFTDKIKNEYGLPIAKNNLSKTATDKSIEAYALSIARRFVRSVLPDLLVQLSGAAVRHDLEAVSFEGIYKAITSARDDVWEMLKTEKSPKEWDKLTLLRLAILCILSEMPGLVDLEFGDEEMNEDGVGKTRPILDGDEEDGFEGTDGDGFLKIDWK